VLRTHITATPPTRCARPGTQEQANAQRLTLVHRGEVPDTAAAQRWYAHEPSIFEQPIDATATGHAGATPAATAATTADATDATAHGEHVHGFAGTQTSKLKRLCGAPVCIAQMLSGRKQVC
jgi:hypothetical protein